MANTYDEPDDIRLTATFTDSAGFDGLGEKMDTTGE